MNTPGASIFGHGFALAAFAKEKRLRERIETRLVQSEDMRRELEEKIMELREAYASECATSLRLTTALSASHSAVIMLREAAAVAHRGLPDMRETHVGTILRVALASTEGVLNNNPVHEGRTVSRESIPEAV